MTDFSEDDLDRKWSQSELEKLSEKELTKLAFLRNLKNILFFGSQAIVVLFLVDKIGKVGFILGWVSIGVALLGVGEMLLAIFFSLITLIPALFIPRSGYLWRLVQLLIAILTLSVDASLAILVYLKMYGH